MNLRRQALARLTDAPVRRGGLHVLLVFAWSLPIATASAKDCGAPQSIRPLAGLIDESKVKQGDASVVAGITGKRIAVVISSNAEKQLAWNESLRQPLTGLYRATLELSGRLAHWEQASRETYDPKEFVAGIVAPFLSAARQVKVMADLAEFRESGFELAVVLDLNFRCSYEVVGFWSGATEADADVEIAAYPLSPAFAMGPVVYGRSTLRAKYLPGHAEADRAREDGVNLRLAAVKDFQTNVSRAYPPMNAAKGPGSELPANRAQGIEARLQVVEDLRMRGLISAAEAEEKRREILKGL